MLAERSSRIGKYMLQQSTLPSSQKTEKDLIQWLKLAESDTAVVNNKIIYIRPEKFSEY